MHKKWRNLRVCKVSPKSLLKVDVMKTKNSILNKLLLYLGILTTSICSSHALSDTWIENDGHSFITIDEFQLTVSSTNSFFYFDEIFNLLRTDGIVPRICFGLDNTNNIASDCFSPDAAIAYKNDGYTREIVFEIFSPFLLYAFEKLLSEGETLRLTIDSGGIYAAYTLNKDNILTEEAINILQRE